MTLKNQVEEECGLMSGDVISRPGWIEGFIVLAVWLR